MYIMITSRCNMKCKHCCNSCTEIGEDMTIETFRKAIAMDSMHTIGGGEPTLHNLFWQFLMEAIAERNSEYVWLATNGSQTEISIVLANLAKKGVIGCALSQDKYHSKIDPVVVKAFTKEKRDGISGYYEKSDNDHREIRNVTGKEIKAGRSKKGKKGCVCEEFVIKPNGDLYGCGCDDAPCFGNINSKYEIPDGWQHGECSKSQNK